jgi:hypothetical protein
MSIKYRRHHRCGRRSSVLEWSVSPYRCWFALSIRPQRS